MTWNYRLVRYLNRQDGDTYYGIHEVYYDKAGKPWAMTEDAISFAGESSEDVIKSLEMALAGAKNKPIFDEPEEGKWPGKPPGIKRNKKGIN